jgi:hypothetical protein
MLDKEELVEQENMVDAATKHFSTFQDLVWSYVERPLRQELFQTFLQRERCGHMSGLFARSSTAGLDEVRDASG